MKKALRIPSFSIILIFICISLIGISLLSLIPTKLSPEQGLPHLTISFSMYGSSPRTVETEVTSKLEAILNRMSGISRISSKSGNGGGRINIEFDKYTDMEISRFEASAIVRQMWPMLPNNVTYPLISQNRIEQNTKKAFLSFTINAPLSSWEIQRYVENSIQPLIARVEGVGKVEVGGATPMIWRFSFDTNKNNSLGVSKLDIQNSITNAFKSSFLNMASHKDLGNSDKEWIRIVLMPSQKELHQKLKENGVKSSDGTFIPLSKLIQADRIEEQPQSYYRLNGLNSIYLSVTAKENVNQIKLAKIIHHNIDKIKANLPSGYEIHNSYDATAYIKAELNKVSYRTILTLFILLSFIFICYRNLKYLLLIVVTITCNLAVAFIFYYIFKIEIQLYSLAGITISLTLIIDNTIVMADHFVRERNRLSFLAILAATLTTIGSLSIIFFLEEKVRLNLQDFAAVIIVNLITSLLIALFLVPALIEKLNINKLNILFQRRKSHKTFKRKKKLVLFFKRPYERIILRLQRRRILVIVFLVLLFGLPVFLIPEKIEGTSRFANLYNNSIGSTYYEKNVKMYIDQVFGGTMRLFVERVYNGSYFTKQEETSLLVTASLPNNSTIKEMNTIVQKMESYLSGFSQIKQFQTTIYNSRQADISIYFTKKSIKNGFPHLLKSNLISKSLELGGGSWGVFGFGDGFNNDVREGAGSYQVEIFGFNYDELTLLANQFKNKLLGFERIKDVTIESEFSWYKNEYDEFLFNLNKEKLAEERIEPHQLYNYLSGVFGSQIYLGNLTYGKNEERMYLSSKQLNDYDIWSLLNMPIQVGDRAYKLSDLAQIKKQQQPQEIGKINQEYRLCLQYEYIGANEQGKKLLNEYLKEFSKTLPVGYTIRNANQDEWWDNQNQDKYWLIILILVVIFFVTSVLFNSLRQPLFIIFIIPISYIGIFLSFYLFKVNFDQGGFASFVLLSGLTINANIYILNAYNYNRKKWQKRSDLSLYIKAWNEKSMPVILTVLSTILGFTPFLIGESKEAFWFPLAVGTISGLVVSTFGTFLFLPLFMGIGRRK